MERDRAYHLSKVNTILEQTDVFVFTFGLTEAWLHTKDGAVFPTCPGTAGGVFDPEQHQFHHFTYEEVKHDAEKFIDTALTMNPAMRFLLTVSPVPLTATATTNHVLSATVYSKSVLRAVCGALEDKYPMVDYFPSFELVASHPMRAMFFMPNLRAVSPPGVRMVMDTFFLAHGDADQSAASRTVAPPIEMDEVCDEALLGELAR